MLVVVLGGSGVAAFGYVNAKTDKTYATKANTLVSDFEKKYSSDYLDKQFNFDSSKTTEQDLAKAQTAIESMKSDAQNSLSQLNSVKSTSRVNTIKGETEDYFNTTIKACNTSLGYLTYSKTLFSVAGSLETVGGEATSLVDVAVQFQTAQKRINDAVAELEKTTPPAGMEEYNKSLIAALKETSITLGLMSTAIQAGDIAAAEGYANTLTTNMTKLVVLETPSSDTITNNIISTSDQQKLNDLPGQINTAANQINQKLFVF